MECNYVSLDPLFFLNIVASIAVTENMGTLTWLISVIVWHVSDAYSPALWVADENNNFRLTRTVGKLLCHVFTAI